jgi:hypothetical protein
MKCKRAVSFYLAVPVLAGLAGLAASADRLSAQSWPGPKRDHFGQSRASGGAPMLAVVALGEQRITIYDAGGKILQAPISTGSTGYETPAGIFSIVQKKEVHESNLYEDGKMPFMQRITWTGIALHAGALPGHPASHGCVRMPLPFAERLFPMTDLGMRVIVVRNDIAPTDISHPALFGSTRKEAALATHTDAALPGSPKHLSALKALAATKAAEADAAAKRASELKRVAARKAAEAAPAAKALRAAESNLAKADELLKAAERALEAASAAPEPAAEGSPANDAALKKAELAKEKVEKARARVADSQSQLQVAQVQAKARGDAAARAAEEVKAAEEVRDLAADAAEEAKRKTAPVQVFVSRKTQRFYVRNAFQPVNEGPVTIREPDKPIGSYVFTALSHHGNSSEVRWNVVSMYKAGASAEPAAAGTRHRNDLSSPAVSADVAGAKAALDRIAIPQEALEKISEIVLPGSSLIISDEGPSIETGKDTDFVVVMSGEPQGALKARKREPSKFRDDDFFGSPFGGGSYRSPNRSPYKGFPFFN